MWTIRLRQRSPIWVSTMLHLTVFVMLLVVTLIEVFWPKPQPHVFEIVSEPVAESKRQSSTAEEPIPNFTLPKVSPLEMPNWSAPAEVPVAPAVENGQPKMTYEEFLKKNPRKAPRQQTTQPVRSNISVPAIDVEKFSVNLEQNLSSANTSATNTLTADERTALERYGNRLYSLLNQAWSKPETLHGANLIATVVFDVSSSGRISNVQFQQGSGNASFDESIRVAFTQVRFAGATPTGQSHTFTMSFKMVN